MVSRNSYFSSSRLSLHRRKTMLVNYTNVGTSSFSPVLTIFNVPSGAGRRITLLRRRLSGRAADTWLSALFSGGVGPVEVFEAHGASPGSAEEAARAKAAVEDSDSGERARC